MKTPLLFTLACLLISSPTIADDSAPTLSYGQIDAYQRVNSSVDTLVSWADGEFLEHQQEGLFQQYPEEGRIIKTTLSLATELRQQATQAAASGDTSRASALLFAAEATALYAAQMPHLLEDRLAQQTRAANE